MTKNKRHINDILDFPDKNELVKKISAFEIATPKDDAEKGKNISAYLDAMRNYIEYADALECCEKDIQKDESNEPYLAYFKNLHEKRLYAICAFIKIRERAEVAIISKEEKDLFDECVSITKHEYIKFFEKISNEILKCFGFIVSDDELAGALGIQDENFIPTVTEFEKIFEKDIVKTQIGKESKNKLDWLLKKWIALNKLDGKRRPKRKSDNTNKKTTLIIDYTVPQLINRGYYDIAREKLNVEENLSEENCLFEMNIYFEKDDFKGALEFLESHEELFSDYVKGIVYFKNGKCEEAIGFLSKELKNIEEKIKNGKTPTKPTKKEINIYAMLADLYLETENFSDALEMTKKFKNRCLFFTIVKRSKKPFLYNKAHLYLINYYLCKNLNEDVDEKDLERFFNYSKNIRRKAFSYIIKYSKFLGYEPTDDDFKNAFFKSKIISTDSYFESLIEGKTESFKTKLKAIWFWQQIIMSQLYITKDTNITEISHYTSKSSFDKMIGEMDLEGSIDFDKYKKPSPLRIYSLSAANDKIEGEVLPQVLIDNGAHKELNRVDENDFIPFQTSFSRSKDSLTMFRLYGKTDGKEGSGVSLTFGKNYFQTDISVVGGCDLYENREDEIHSIISGETKQPVAWVLYYEKKNDEDEDIETDENGNENSEVENGNFLFYYPNKCTVEPTKIELKLKSAPNWKKAIGDKETPSFSKKILEYGFYNLFKEFNSIKGNGKKKKQEEALSVLYLLRYFIKTADFAEEKEIRLFELIGLASGGVRDGKKNLYVAYKNIWQYDALKNVTFDPKSIDQAELDVYKKRISWRKKIKVGISNAPLA